MELDGWEAVASPPSLLREKNVAEARLQGKRELRQLAPLERVCSIPEIYRLERLQDLELATRWNPCLPSLPRFSRFIRETAPRTTVVTPGRFGQ